MAEKKSLDWPEWESSRYAFPNESMRVSYQNGVEAGVKAVIERVEAMCTPDCTDTRLMILREEWEQLREEAGLELAAPQL